MRSANTEQYLECPLGKAAQTHPDALAIIAPHRSYTYAEYYAHVNGVAYNLRKAGLAEGHLVALALPPGTPYPILLMGIFQMGAIALPVNTRFPAQYLLEVVQRVRCRNMVVPYGVSTTTVQGHLYALAPHDLVETPMPAPSAPPLIPVSRPATLVLTSGSVGAPKAALHSYGNHYHNALRANANMPLTSTDRWLMSLPMFHVAGLGVLFRCLLANAAVVFSAANESIPQAIEKYAITHLSLVPTQLFRLLQSQEGIAALQRLKAILLGGGAVSASLIRRAHELAIPVHTTYGLTEMCTQVTTTPPGASLESLQTSGYPLNADSIRIHESGEIQVRGETLFLGYVEEDALQRPLTPDGWFATGDLGSWDATGALRVTGRRDNMFVVGGENVQPEEVEVSLCSIDGVAVAMVVSIDDEEYGSLPVAFLQGDEMVCSDTTKLRATLEKILPKYKIPRYFYPWPTSLPVGIKVSRKTLRTEARKLLER